MYKYFKDSELICKHCDGEGIDPAFMQKVDKLRPYGYLKGGKVSKALRSNCNHD